MYCYLGSVTLKLLNNDQYRYYCVRIGQLLGQEKFRGSRHKHIYYGIKVLKKLLGLNLSMFMIKKLLWKPSVQFVHYTTVHTNEFLLMILLHPEMRRECDKWIKLDEWKILPSHRIHAVSIPFRQ